MRYSTSSAWLKAKETTMNEEKPMDSRELNRAMIVPLVLVAIATAFSVWAWFSLPADIRIPIHWGADGQPNGFADKTRGLFLMPAIAIVLVIAFRLLPLIEPRRMNLMRSFIAYRAVVTSAVALLCILHLVNIMTLMKLIDVTVSSVVGILVSALMIVTGNYLGKVRSNFMFGVRTPWTLSSNYTWDKTHRLAGRLFVLSGLVGLVTIPLFTAIGFKLFLACVILSALAAVVYSWVVWRNAPDR